MWFDGEKLDGLVKGLELGSIEKKIDKNDLHLSPFLLPLFCPPSFSIVFFLHSALSVIYVPVGEIAHVSSCTVVGELFTSSFKDSIEEKFSLESVGQFPCQWGFDTLSLFERSADGLQLVNLFRK